MLPGFKLRLVPRRHVFAILLLLVGTACDTFYDEGARFAGQAADFAADFRKSPGTNAVFDDTPKYGADQRVRYMIGRIRWCPEPPCNNQGAAMVIVERGKSGTAHKIATAASVPLPLQIEKTAAPVHVYMRKKNGAVQIIELR